MTEQEITAPGRPRMAGGPAVPAEKVEVLEVLEEVSP
jgi:hypothetical protein